jgi:hypothetical protein
MNLYWFILMPTLLQLSIFSSLTQDGGVEVVVSSPGRKVVDAAVDDLAGTLDDVAPEKYEKETYRLQSL